MGVKTVQAHEESFSFIKKECYYDVPFFQRNYVWIYDNWEELLSNLINPTKCSFLGSIILKQTKIKSGQIGRFMVIDGQQRLTTLSILLRACYNVMMKDNEYPDSARRGFEAALDTHLFVTINDFTGEKDVKIKHSHIDRPFYESVIKGEISVDENLPKIMNREEYELNLRNPRLNQSRILLCYKYFKEQLEKCKNDEIKDLWHTLTKDDVKFLVNIDLLDNENEQAIFDSVNSSGIRLTSADTIKNALFQRYIELMKNETSTAIAEESAIKLYKDSWESIFLLSIEDAQYWSTQHQSGRLFRDNIEILLHCVAVIEGFFDPTGMKMSELAQYYKKYISDMTSQELEAFIKHIKEYADLYKSKIVTNEVSLQYSYTDYFTKLVHVLDQLEISTFHPYLLHILLQNKKSQNEEQFKEDCLKLERYVILHAICNASTKNYNKECNQLIKGESIDTMLANTSDINRERFNNGLCRMYSNKIATMLLFWVELYKRSIEKTDQTELKYTYTLEHIMPQKWQEYWDINILPVIDSDGNIIIDEEDAKNTRADAIYEAGNMTLLNSKLNSSLRNYSFEKKINGYNKKKGMKDLADCMITREILNKASWTEEDIRARTEDLKIHIKRIWNISY